MLLNTDALDRLCTRCWVAFHLPGQEMCRNCVQDLRLVAVADRVRAREADVRRQAEGN